jgi:hypothetical protein
MINLPSATPGGGGMLDTILCFGMLDIVLCLQKEALFMRKAVANEQLRVRFLLV